jgi:hypothetical protein
VAAKGRTKTHGQGVGFYQMLRDVLIASINKGQFPWAILAMIVIAVIFRMPPDDVSKLAFRVLDALERGALLGYALAFFATAGWFFHSRYQRRIITVELNRMSKQRNQLQAHKLGNKIRSSEGRT